jgi:hypothetical protein
VLEGVHAGFFIASPGVGAALLLARSGDPPAPRRDRLPEDPAPLPGRDHFRRGRPREPLVRSLPRRTPSHRPSHGGAGDRGPGRDRVLPHLPALRTTRGPRTPGGSWPTCRLSLCARIPGPANRRRRSKRPKLISPNAGLWPEGRQSTVSEVESNGQRAVELKQFAQLKRTQVVREQRLRKAHKLVTVDAALMFQSLLDIEIGLCRQTIPPRVDGCTDYRRERRVDDGLSTDDHKHTLSSWVRGGGVLDPLHVATVQSMTWYESTSSASWFSSSAWALMISRSRAGSRFWISGKYSLKAASTSSERCSGSGARVPRAAASSSERKTVVSIFIPLSVLPNWPALSSSGEIAKGSRCGRIAGESSRSSVLLVRHWRPRRGAPRASPSGNLHAGSGSPARSSVGPCCSDMCQIH